MKYYELAIKSLHERLKDLEERVAYLEQENIGLTNELYELQHRQDVLEYPKYETLKNFGLGDS